MTETIIDFIRKRRTQYALGPTLPVSVDETTTLIKDAVRHAPSTFNSQSSRVVVLFGSQSRALWDVTRETLRGIAPKESFASTDRKMTAFAAGAGSVLFFEDQSVVEGLQEKYPLYADNFSTFSEHASGMAQFAVWTALANAGIGASLQHYNPLIDEKVRATWALPASWKLKAQMPFGSNNGPLPEKTFIDDRLRFRVFR